MLKKTITLISFAIIGQTTWSMEPEKGNGFHSIILPGQNGLGGEKALQYNIVNSSYSKYETLTNQFKIDMGQGNCIKDFQQQLDNDEQAKNKECLLYGISQGTATLTNWLAQQPQEKQKQVKALILESVLGHGDNAILHTTEKMVSDKATYLPFARWWCLGQQNFCFLPTTHLANRHFHQ